MAVLPPDPVFTLKGDMGYVHSLSFVDYEKTHTSTLLAATESGFVHIWDLETNRMKYKQKLGESIQAIHSIDDKVFTQEKSGQLKLWSVRESHYEELRCYECSGGYCRSLRVDRRLVVPREKSALDVVDVPDMTRLASLVPTDGNLGSAMCLEKIVVGDSPCVLAGYETGRIVLFDLKTLKQCGQLQLRECAMSMTFDAGTGRGICGNASNVLQLFTVGRDLAMALKCEIGITNEGCNVVKLRADRKILVSGGWDGRLRLFSWKTLRLLAVLTEHRKCVTDVQFSPNDVDLWKSNIMAASGGDGIISLWNLYN